MEIREGLTFDDVLLVPKMSNVVSRSDTDISTSITQNVSINIPFISSRLAAKA